MDNPFKSPTVLSFCPGLLGLETGIQRITGKLNIAAYVEIEAFIIANLVAGMEYFCPTINNVNGQLEVYQELKHNSPQDKDTSNITGKSQEWLNPAWDAQLMGTTLERIFFVPLATWSCQTAQK